MFKKFLTIFFSIITIVSFQISIPSCENPLSSEVNTTEIMSDVFEPTNKYYADVRIIKMGLFGCVQSSVLLDGEPLTDVEIKINKTRLEENDFGVFEDSEDKLDYTERTKYSLVIKRGVDTIATGTTYMPSKPKIMNLSEGDHHNVNTPLRVDWQFTPLASAIGITLESGSFDNTESQLLPIFPSTYTIPGHLITEPGSYMLYVTAYNGIAPGTNVSELDSSIGFNIIGPAGIFVAMNMDDPITIEVE